MALVLQCPECDKTFSSIMLFDEHLHKNSRESFLKTYAFVMQYEIALRNQTSLQPLVDDVIMPELIALRNQARKQSKNEKRKYPKLAKHKKVGGKKK